MRSFHAVMDIGTNSCRLIIAEKSGNKDFTHLRQLRITRIGEGLGSGNLHISRAAMDRTLSALIEYMGIIKGYPVDKVILLGTQALREADNSREFTDEVKVKTGFDLEIISGVREAFLSYTGVVSGLKTPDEIKPLVLDIGGGSTELFWEEGGIKGASAPIGGLRLLERPLDQQGISDALKAGWNNEEVPGWEDKNRPLIAVGGTATTLGAIYLNMDAYDPEILNGSCMSRRQVEDIDVMLRRMTPDERLALPGMSPGREDIMPWALKILLGAMTYCRRESVTVYDRDLLYGAIWADSAGNHSIT